MHCGRFHQEYFIHISFKLHVEKSLNSDCENFISIHCISFCKKPTDVKHKIELTLFLSSVYKIISTLLLHDSNSVTHICLGTLVKPGYESRWTIRIRTLVVSTLNDSSSVQSRFSLMYFYTMLFLEYKTTKCASHKLYVYISMNYLQIIYLIIVGIFT